MEEKTYDVDFIGMQLLPVRNRGLFSHAGTEEEALAEFKKKLEESYGENNYQIQSFTEVQDTTPEIDKEKLN